MNKELKNCPICGSHRGKQTWDTRYGLERELTYECFDCGYKEQDEQLLYERSLEQ